MKKLIILFGLMFLAVAAYGQNNFRYPLVVGLNGGTGGYLKLNGATSGSMTLLVPAIAGTTTLQFPTTFGTSGYVLTTNGAGVLTWAAGGGGGGGSMVYPSGSGIPLVVSGTSWGTTITNNSNNWNTAYGWGNHASVGYAPSTNTTLTGTVTLPSTTSIGNVSSTELGFNDGLNGTSASRQDVRDSLAQALANAVEVIAVKDSTGRAVGNYVTHNALDDAIAGVGGGSGEISAARLPFIIGVTAGAPTTSDSTIGHGAFLGKHVDLYRNGAKQYQNSTATNTVNGFRLNSSTITVHPLWQANEQVMVDIIEPISWTALSITTLATGLISAWKFDETTGNAVDQMGTTSLTVNGTVTQNQTGKIGKCYQFAGAGSVGGVDATYEPAGAFSLSVWMKTTTQSTPMAMIGNYYGTSDGYHLIVDEYTRIYFVVADHNQTPGFASTVYQNAVVYSGNWHHYVATWDGSLAKIYCDGALVNTSAAWNHNAIYHEDSRFYIGRNMDGAGQFFTGSLDEPRFWSKCLTSTEVTELYTKENAGTSYPW